MFTHTVKGSFRESIVSVIQVTGYILKISTTSMIGNKKSPGLQFHRVQSVLRPDAFGHGDFQAYAAKTACIIP